MQHTPNTCANKTALADRRVISVAIVNCSASNPLNGNSIPFVQSHSYAEFFITKPVDTQENIIWAEFVQMITPSTPGGTGPFSPKRDRSHLQKGPVGR